MKHSIQYIKEQANTLLFFVKANTYNLPVVLIIFNIFAYLTLFSSIYYSINKLYHFQNPAIDLDKLSLPNWYIYIEGNIRHMFEASGTLLLLLWGYYKKMGYYNRLSIIMLTFLFSINSLYYVFNTPIDCIYIVAVWGIYITFVIITVGKVLIRC